MFYMYVLTRTFNCSTMGGTAKELEAFCDWLEAQPHKHKVVVSGNHDFGLEGEPKTERMRDVRLRLKRIATHLENAGAEICGLKFWGAPQTPNIPRRKPMAFQGESEALEPHWREIPSGLDVLVTHGPPRGFGDRILLGMHVGCPKLLQSVMALDQPPRFHVFGHIHEGYGTWQSDDSSVKTVFINCAIANTLYRPIHAPILLEIQK